MSLSHFSNIVRTGLVMYLDSINSKSYPGSGSTWIDLSTSNNNATLVGSPAFSNGVFTWDGTNNYATTGFTPNKNAGTFCAWIRMATLKDFNTIIDNELSADDWEFWVYSTGRPRFRTTNTNVDVDLYPANTLSAGTNYFLTVTYDATTAIMYLNGVQIASDTVSFASRSTPLTLNIAGKNNTKFQGNIYAFLAYDRALTQTEVIQNFYALRGRYSV
jgi:hypothetical protein